jgi:hypothetical protein
VDSLAALERRLFFIGLPLGALAGAVCYLDYPLPIPDYNLLPIADRALHGIASYLAWVVSILVANAVGGLIHLLVKRLFPEVRPTMAVHGYWLGLNLVLFVLIGFDWVLQFLNVS